MAVASRDELAVFCHLDEGPLLDHAVELAEENEAILKSYGIVRTAANDAKFCRAVKEMTLNDIDYPGTEYPKGTQKLINELKPKHF